ncbi:MAG TPA: aminotransferase class I/II-fold pyridoxal phosphate-dependent enzyme [Variovorax sp.]|jgi:histidinol-phosphate aminotransferase
MMQPDESAPLHGGPDANGVLPHDFSTNANACGPCPSALRAVQAADAASYPDPRYTALREALARFHAVAPARIVMAASASEFIGRMTAAVAQAGGRRVWLPPLAYADYRRGANAWQLEVVEAAQDAGLLWCCDPASPTGQPQPALAQLAGRLGAEAHGVLDLAYEPLRLDGRLDLTDEQRDAFWQLWTPNKALGLTGVRAAYAIAPPGAEALAARLDRLAPSWPLGAHGVALLAAWTTGAAQQWLAGSLDLLRTWKAQQQGLCESLGWTCMPSVANFFCARPDLPCTAARQAALRQAGIRLRDTGSFGLPGHVRLGVLAPASQAALRDAWLAVRG